MNTCQDIKKRTMNRCRKVDTSIDQLAPCDELSDKKCKPENAADDHPLSDASRMISAYSMTRKLDGDTAGKQHERTSPDDPRNGNVLPLRRAAQHDISAAEPCKQHDYGRQQNPGGDVGPGHGKRTSRIPGAAIEICRRRRQDAASPPNLSEY